MNALPIVWPLSLALALLAVAPPAKSAAEARLARARALVSALAKEDFAAAGKDFDAAVKKALPEDKLRAFWKDLLDKVGPLKSHGKTRTESAGRYEVVYVSAEFAKATVDFKVVFDKTGRIAGFFLTRPGKAHTFEAPPYAKPSSFREVAVTIGAGGPWPLPGTLTLPKGEGPFPGVVLVQGSGPHDRDETLGPNKPLRDLAWGLATQGIAVLRYEKRTLEHTAKTLAALDKLTIKEEVIDDAVAAAALLRKQKGVDGKKVFVLGHSLGAHVAPAIGARDHGLAGLILLAGNSRPLEDLVLEQYAYLFSLKGKLSDEDKKELERIKKAVAKVKDPRLSPDTPAKELPLGLSAAYWRALRAYDPVKTARGLEMPLLVLQGERDYQVTPADLAGWKKGLAGREKVTFKSYPALNHLFMEGKGKSRPEEYDRAGHVAKEVVDDVAAWIKGR
jgi:dienelactone hydrolase